MSGLQLPGSLTITKASLDAVGTSLELTVSAEVAETARLSAAGTQQNFSYYIQSDYDINSKITYYGNDDDVTKGDDAYSMVDFSVTNLDAITPSIYLPPASDITVLAGKISALNVDNSVLGDFDVKLTVDVNGTGVMSSTIAISGVAKDASTTDNAAFAQSVYWSGINTVPNPSATDTDILTKQLSTGDLDIKYAAELLAINNNYDGQNMISAWTISLSAISQANDNILSQHARFKGRSGSDIFVAGDKLVCSTPASYSVSIEDYTGTATSIIPTTSIYGVLIQT